MDPDTGQGNTDHRFMCETDVANVGQVVGFATDQTYASYNYGWPTPNSSWIPPAVAGEPYGLGFVDAARGLVAGSQHDTQTQIQAASGAPASPAVLCDFNVGFPYPCVTHPAILHQSQRRPSLALDHTRGVWWLFDVKDDSIFVQKSTDQVTWTSLGLLTAGPNLTAKTRVPVSATYDVQSDSILVAFTNYKSGNVTPPCYTTNQLGCTGDTGVAVLLPTATSAANASIYRFAGSASAAAYGGVGAPAIACGPIRPNYRNCEIVVVGGDSQRNPYAWALGFSPTARALTNGTAYVVGGGFDEQPSLTNPSSGGAWILAVRGTDSRVYLKTKPNVATAWSAWSNWSWVPVGAGATNLAPVVRSLGNGVNNHVLLVAP